MTNIFRQTSIDKPLRIDFYVGDRFSIVPFINALDPLRIANIASGKTLFETRLISDDGKPVTAINGIALTSIKPLLTLVKLTIFFYLLGLIL
ncbi:MAG: hypothetical protein OXC62_03935 [Aestuariivita sp.]|nr:hypothetical protein [Aestuariivita sp.]